MRRAVTSLLFAVLALCGCGVDTEGLFATGGDSGTGVVSGGGGGGASPCTEGARCAEADSPCCAGDDVLACTKGRYTVAATCGIAEACGGDPASCNCVPESRRCTDGGAAQECVAGVDGPTWQTTPCGASELCEHGDCMSLDLCFGVGSLRCAEDGARVLRCTASHHLETVLDCKAAGFAKGCVPLDGASPVEPADLCVNACGIRSVALNGTLCSVVSGLPCAVYACSTDGKTLAPDHTDCVSQGFPCKADAECATCSCKDGQCFGAAPAPCPEAELSQCE